MNNSISDNYRHLLMEVQQRIRAAQYDALKAVNREMINLYWDIGKMIVTRQQNVNWGKSVVEQLAKDLQAEFPGISGFSTRNIWRMRDFYLTYHSQKILPPLVAEIGWTHNVVILEKCKDDLEREFYIKMTRKFGWTKNVLIHQIENQTYQKTLLNQTNFNKTVPTEIRNQLKLAVKDEYTFDFLELADEHSERQLEQAILTRVEPFLQEMGGLFAFIGSQYRLEVDDEEYFIDILLYHRRLKCLVAIELKIGKFLPEYVGKMQFYLSVLDNTVKLPDENPSIGIILCKSKQRTIVEYALKDSNKPIGVATYQIVSQLPQELKNQLPDPEQIAKLLEGFE
ncbi:putative nuclease (plasmid) [Anabaena sp. 90]|uniref:PDDEXK nuclease domain-containing protein n=1 Tax=Anabaena sp. 90 TaxID=46234 RepID=UPI00029B7605|nr:PDDEXK nuclease domain-containing protein [Anabaena sp. 90]AFW97303.1 putative nuclease [Anabaena sp. 90]